MTKVNWNMLYPDGKKLRVKFRRTLDDDLRELNKLYKQVSKSSKKLASHDASFSNGVSSRDKHGIYNYNSNKQFVVTKMNYSQKLSSHKKFLRYYIAQENKEEVNNKPILFGRDDNASADLYEERMVANHFKFIISPESPNVPLKEFTKTYMEKISFELGIKFDWQAAVHTDTDHPHVHILVNGKDLDGNILKRPFPKAFIKNRTHIIASDIVTNMVGERTEQQRKEAYIKSFTATRWTKHDEIIAKLAGEKNRLVAVSDVVKKRLSHLCNLKLAKHTNGIYELQKKWDTTLKHVGRYNSFIKAQDELKWTLPGNLELFTSASGKISGVVRKCYALNDEYENNNAIVLEEKGKAYFVPLYNPPPKVEGKMCTVSMTTNSKGRVVPEIKIQANDKNENKQLKQNINYKGIQ